MALRGLLWFPEDVQCLNKALKGPREALEAIVNAPYRRIDTFEKYCKDMAVKHGKRGKEVDSVLSRQKRGRPYKALREGLELPREEPELISPLGAL